MKSTQRTRLMLPEYGRNVQEMVSYLKTIEDRDRRNEQARVVVAIMGNIYPYKRDTEEFIHMLWDHLFMIADFDLDIDCPFPKPTSEMFEPKPDTIPYSQEYFTKKHYGINARRIIRKIVESDESNEDKIAAVSCVARFIRQQAYNFNHEYPSNEIIISDIQRVCGQDLEIDMSILAAAKLETPPTQQKNRYSNNNNKKQNQQHRNNNNNNNNNNNRNRGRN